MTQEVKYTCPCCGYKTLDEAPPGTFSICHICFWEDDNVQFDDPNYDGGANTISLKQAQKNFMEFGACESSAMKHVKNPSEQEQRDINWKPL